ncbi:MAG: ATP-binding cassette domain-containing protein [Cyclobacteriaceae bacterium]|nr:ATP-binding cassette domain-containing protein [Cyclobacteriaceae bacterium]MCH8516821.1 ATP-binding cassette domain-containing protein [Cyclobacteriaceae bacterium]
MAHLLVDRISKQYGNHIALKDVSFEIPKGKIFGLLGPNGAGKTSTIRMLTRILYPDSGEILFENEPLADRHVRSMGYLPEERGLYKKMGVSEQLIYLAQLKGMSKSDAIREINHWFDRLEVDHWKKKKVEDLSKGMQQKIQFISTVLHRPNFLILDEPFSGFDPVNAEKIKSEVIRLKEEGATILLSTHRMESVEELCDNICMIHQAQKILDGSVRDIRESMKEGLVQVRHKEPLEERPMKDMLAEYIDGKTEAGAYVSRFRLAPYADTNALIQWLLNHVTLISFEEALPSIHDIFVKLVSQDVSSFHAKEKDATQL